MEHSVFQERIVALWMQIAHIFSSSHITIIFSDNKAITILDLSLDLKIPRSKEKFGSKHFNTGCTKVGFSHAASSVICNLPLHVDIYNSLIGRC